MKRTILKGSFLIALLMISIQGFPQYFLAGQHGSGNYYYDIDPDTTLAGPYNHAENLPPAIYRIDINNDGVNDFYLHSSGTWANGFGGGSLYIRDERYHKHQSGVGYLPLFNLLSMGMDGL